MKKPRISGHEQDSTPKKISFWRILLGSLIGVVFEIGGYFLLRGNQAAFGWVMFIGVPLVSGFAVSLFTETTRQAFFGILIAGILGIAFLIGMQWEGWICCLMASPFLLGFAAIGAWMATAIMNRFKTKKTEAIVKLLFLLCSPAVLLGAKSLEAPFLIARPEIFIDRVTLPVTCERAWDLIKTIDHVETEKPFLLSIGLPVPQTCELDREEVGGKRTCNFDSGKIEQEIVEWNRPTSMKLKITNSTLPGRHWLSFIEAGYSFSPDGTNAIVTRYTTISSRLYPRWYWRPFEAWGVQSEHEYVLSDLERRSGLNSK